MTTTFLLYDETKPSGEKLVRVTTPAACPMLHDKPEVVQEHEALGYHLIGHIDNKD